jgi:hypothetical protein
MKEAYGRSDQAITERATKDEALRQRDTVLVA